MKDTYGLTAAKKRCALEVRNIRVSCPVYIEQTGGDRMDEALLNYLPFLAPRCAEMALITARSGMQIHEIRLRRGLPISFTVSDGRNIPGATVSPEEMEETVLRMCGGSLHAHEETIRQGYLVLPNGGRAGIVGRAETVDGKIIAVRDVSAIDLRIPHSIRGIGAELCRRFRENGFSGGILVYSPPGGGKTTLLRDAAATLAGPNFGRRVALIDTRQELFRADMFSGTLTDVLSGYPKGVGISIATRVLSPELLVCDEIGSDEEADAILAAQHTGIPLLASAHGSSPEALMKRKGIARLVKSGVFELFAGIRQTGAQRKCMFSSAEAVGLDLMPAK